MQPTSTANRVLQVVKRVLAEAFSLAVLLGCLYANFYIIALYVTEGDWNRISELAFVVAGSMGASFAWRRLVKRYDGAIWVPFRYFPLPVIILAAGFLAALSGQDLPVFPDVRATVLSAERDTAASGDAVLRVELKLEAVRSAHEVGSVWNYTSLHGNDGEKYEAGYVRPNAAKPSPCAGPGDSQLSVREPIVCQVTFSIPKRLTSGYVTFDNRRVSDRTPTFDF